MFGECLELFPRALRICAGCSEVCDTGERGSVNPDILGFFVLGEAISQGIFSSFPPLFLTLKKNAAEATSSHRLPWRVSSTLLWSTKLSMCCKDTGGAGRVTWPCSLLSVCPRAVTEEKTSAHSLGGAAGWVGKVIEATSWEKPAGKVNKRHLCSWYH